MGYNQEIKRNKKIFLKKNYWWQIPMLTNFLEGFEPTTLKVINAESKWHLLIEDADYSNQIRPKNSNRDTVEQNTAPFSQTTHFNPKQTKNISNSIKQPENRSSAVSFKRHCRPDWSFTPKRRREISTRSTCFSSFSHYYLFYLL